MAPDPSPHWRLLARLVRPQRYFLAALGVALAVAAALPLAGPQLLRAFIDTAVEGAAITSLLMIAAAYVALGVAAQATNVATAYAATRVAWDATNMLRERAAAHALHLDLAFHGASSPGSLVERVDGDATAIAKFFTDFVVKVVVGALTLAGALVLVAREDWRVGVAMTVFVALAGAVTIRLRDRAVPQNTAERAAFAEVVGLVEEQLDGSEDLRALGARDYALHRHERASAQHMATAMRAEKAGMWIWVSTTGFFAVGGALMLLAGWRLERANAISIGTVFLLFQYSQILRRPVEMIAQQLQQVQQAAAGAARLGRLLGETPTLSPGGRTRLPEGALRVEFEGVQFAYPDDGRPVLADIDFEVPAGSVVGLVGHTGSGKTTLARLALRLVEPTGGCVRVGGIDLREADPLRLRERIAVVTQDVQLFDASIRDNLTLFDESSDDAALTALLDDLGLGEWLAGLPAGLDTMLGSRAGLSAGQAQLLGLGRAFLRDPGLVVLDEASSKIDPLTAELLEVALTRLLKGRTALVIAHRLTAVERADAIVVLDAGRIVESGPRQALADDPMSRFHHLLELEREAAR